MKHPQAGGSYRRDKEGGLTPIGKSEPETSPREDEIAPAAPAPKKGK